MLLLIKSSSRRCVGTEGLRLKFLYAWALADRRLGTRPFSSLWVSVGWGDPFRLATPVGFRGSEYSRPCANHSTQKPR